MAYKGMIVPVRFGSAGLQTDVAQVLQAPFSPFAPSSLGLLMATNVSLRYGSVEKEGGSVRWNQSAYPAGIAAFNDWWPVDELQRIIVVCKDGKVYRQTSPYERSEVVAVNEAPSTLTPSSQTHMVWCGTEQQGNPRKLFIFTGNDPVQVITGDGTTRSNISKPALDWGSNNWPTMGVVHDGAVWVWGCPSNPHTVYRSSPSDHEDFQTVGEAQLVTVFPGDGSSILAGIVFKTRLYVVKYPLGLYYIDDTGTFPIPFKLSDSFGAGSIHSAVSVLDDVLIANSSGSITSLHAVNALGNTEQGDVLKMLKCVSFMQENSNQNGTDGRQMVYYEDKKQVLITYRSPSGTKNDRVLKLDYHAGEPKVTWSDKDQANCLGLIRDVRHVPRPFYGSDDGYLYQMEHVMRNVGGSAFKAMWQTPFLDFGFLDKKLEELDKIFDFIGVTYESQGKWNLLCDVFVDDRFVQTIQFDMGRGTHLDGAFPLDKARLAGPGPVTPKLQPISAMGRRISLRFYQSGLNQGFKVSAVNFYFRPAGQNNA